VILEQALFSFQEDFFVGLMFLEIGSANWRATSSIYAGGGCCAIFIISPRGKGQGYCFDTPVARVAWSLLFPR
jgi:hypothetical protein